MAATIKTQDRELTNVDSSTDSLGRVVTGVSQVGIGLGVMLAGLTGLWALASIISAVAKSGGVVLLIRQWWGAVTGM
ncbi:MAG: hypothetical protein ABFQ82_01595 [Thermodesulfobacteriota bacterium]